MKAIVHIIGCGLLAALSLSSCSVNTTKGNGKIIEKEIAIHDYSILNLGGWEAQVAYQQSDEAPYLKIECDENILPLLEIRSANDSLTIQPPKEDLGRFITTQFRIQTNSRSIKVINLAGKIQFEVADSLIAPDLEIALAGASRLHAPKMRVDDLRLNIAGKCDADLSGSAEQVELNLAGQCSYRAMELKTSELNTNIAGSCSMEVYVTDKIKLSEMGKCDITYKGNPSIEHEGVTLGNIKQVGE